MEREKVFGYIKEHKEAFTVSGLLILCFLLYFFAIGNYPLIDPYETKFVSIARSMYKTGELFVLNLNGNFFFEAPPLYFWIESLAFSIFGKVSETIARIPVAFCATIGVFLVYIFCRKIISRKYAVVASLILATSLMYTILAKIAVTDMLFSVCTGIAVYSGIYTLLCSEAHKKYFWWLFYIFAGFCLMIKGFTGILVPFAVIFLCSCFSRKFKKIFRPVFLIPGLLFFFLIVFPWHWIMFSNFNPMFFNEYILKQHVDKYWYLFANGNPAPWYIILLAFLSAFLPWIFSFVAQIIVFFKDKWKEFPKYFTDFNSLNFPQKFIFYNIVYFLAIIIIFSFLATKHPVYVLPALIPASVILPKFWIDYFEEEKHHIAINITMGVWTLIIAACIAGIFFVPNYFEGQQKQELIHIQPEMLLLLLVVFTMQIFAYLRKAKKVLFSSLIVLMTGLSMIVSTGIFNFICSMEQYDVVLYSMIAKQEGAPIVTYNTPNTYSVLYYYDKEISTFAKKQIEAVLSLSKTYPETRILITNSELNELNKKYTFKIIGKGLKYSLIQNIKPKED